MSWITMGEEKGKHIFVSNKENNGILHNGSYLTVEDKDKKIKFILRVEDTQQNNPYSPSPMLVDVELSTLLPDQKCQNIVHASRIIEHPERDDGKSSFIKPQLPARRSNQEEVNLAFGCKNGMSVFPATVFARSCQHLKDDEGKFISVKIPDEVFFHQMLITGSTGSGKTVAMKYMAQHFLEKYEEEFGGGAILAVNVKEEDMLTLDKPTKTENPILKKEWEDLKLTQKGIETFKIYYPGNRINKYSKSVDINKCERLTLMTQNVDPESLTGLIQNISSLGADQLPAIFRYWKLRVMDEQDSMVDFIRYFGDTERNRRFMTLNNREEEIEITMHSGTHQNVLNALTYAAVYFDIKGAKEVTAEDILERGKFSVIDVTTKNGFIFGSVILRDLLEKIYDFNSKREPNERIPILLIIDEVHEFYGNVKSREALQTLDVIARKGRSLKIGVIFASQNMDSLPKGISTVVNTKIHFRSDEANMRSLGINIPGFDGESLKDGYAMARIHGLNQLRFLKFPMATAGVYDGKK